MSRPSLISILVRTHNDAAFIVRTLDGIAEQVCDYPHEVLVCNDHSTDATEDLIRTRSDVRLVPCPRGAYRPGRTLNALVRAATGEIVVFNNADAIPLNRQWLQNLVEPLVGGGGGCDICKSDAASGCNATGAEGFGTGLWGWFSFRRMAALLLVGLFRRVSCGCPL